MAPINRSDHKFGAYMKLLLGGAFVLIVILWAYNQGSRDGAQHAVEQKG